MDKTISQIIVEQSDNLTSWKKLFDDSEAEIKLIDRNLAKLGEYYPRTEDVFNAFKLTPLDKIRVVIIGQDPYHSCRVNEPDAMGLSFSVKRGHTVPPSLRNMFIEIGRTANDSFIPKSLADHYPDVEMKPFKMPKHGDLTSWANQGVFLLNRCLTVTPHIAGSHGDIWAGFIDRTIELITKTHSNCIFVLLGKEAQRISSTLSAFPPSAEMFKSYLESGDENVRKKNTKEFTSNCIILETSHPSPLSSKRGFDTSGIFHKVNVILFARSVAKHGVTQEALLDVIDWNLC